MKNNSKIMLLIALIVWIMGSLLPAQSATHIPGNQLKNSLEAKWEWAENTAKQEKHYYIAYSVTPAKEHDGSITYYSWTKAYDGPTVYEVIFGKKAEKDLLQKLQKQAVVFYRFNGKLKEIQPANFTNSQHKRLKAIPVFWIGEVKIPESIALLDSFYKGAVSGELKEEIVSVGGLHGRDTSVFRFLKGVLKGETIADVRETAVFWMGLQQSPEAVKILLKVIHNDPSMDVREQAIFGLHVAETKEADAELIKLATGKGNVELRKMSIFWLGQRAVKRTAEILGDVVGNDAGNDIQEAAVFSLSQHPKGLDKLIRIAKTHRSLNVR
ncbi:MAG: HEAT repeat domain-containing protein, partial [bacterium]|nr:HEAT repeat domain-containing protein [bacterium]